MLRKSYLDFGKQTVALSKGPFAIMRGKKYQISVLQPEGKKAGIIKGKNEGKNRAKQSVC